jgi:hypothetical protein
VAQALLVPWKAPKKIGDYIAGEPRYIALVHRSGSTYFSGSGLRGVPAAAAPLWLTFDIFQVFHFQIDAKALSLPPA